ncbi:MAG TPA: hypothetical protein VFD91_06540, partial [Mariniphaga sp.]|nr:hypothetical protein [Mariniphaga sp.]
MSIIITNETIKQLFHIAQSIAKENYNERYGASHLLQALMHREIDLRGFLESIDKDPNYIHDWADVRIEEYPTTTQIPSEIGQDNTVEQIIEAADDVRLKLGLDEITPICVIAAIVKPGIAFSAEQLKSLPLKEHEIFSAFGNTRQTFVPDISGMSGMGTSNGSMSFPAIQSYCVDKTAQ